MITSIILSSLVLIIIEISAAEEICTEAQFKEHYIHIKDDRKSPPTITYKAAGIIDLRHHTKKFICINGAVVLYNDVIEMPGSGKGKNNFDHHLSSPDNLLFKNGTYLVLSHKCLPLNWEPGSKNNSANEFDLPTIGTKAKGVFLIAPPKESASDPSSKIKMLFNKKHFGHLVGSEEDIYKDVSIVVSGRGPYCVKVKDQPHPIKITTSATADTDICKWSLSSSDVPGNEYKVYFQSCYKWEEYVWDDTCTPGTSTGTTTKDGKDITKAFATIDLDKLDLRKGEIDCPREPPELLQEQHTINIDDCQSLPAFDEAKAPPACKEPNPAECASTSPDYEILNVALDIDNTNTIKDDENLYWKYDVLALVASIFSKVCIPIRKPSVYQVMRIIDYYLKKAHLSNAALPQNKANIWDILIANLEKCNEHKATKPMEWEWPRGAEINPLRPFVTPAPVPPPPPPDNSTGNDTGTGEANKSRKRRAILPNSISSKSLLDVFASDEMELDELLDEKLIIQRSPPDYLGDTANEFVSGTIPRWGRQVPKVPLPFIQEYIPPESTDDKDKDTYEDFIFFPDPAKIKIKDLPKSIASESKEIYYYNDAVELTTELNPVIDAFWKIFLTVFGYCKKYDTSRGHAMLALFYHNFDEDLLTPLKEEWQKPTDPFKVEMVAGEFGDSDRSKWLDTCVETAFIISDGIALRPPRPLDFESVEETPEGTSSPGEAKKHANLFVGSPEDEENGADKYFVKKIKHKRENGH